MKPLSIVLLLLFSLIARSQPQSGRPTTDLAVIKAETYRPRYHFTAPKNWINDPNGLVHHDGEYHLFYQHNPFDNVWGHMSWGHAVSKNLLNWHHLPLAIPAFTQADGRPDRRTAVRQTAKRQTAHTAIFSGSVVVDKSNKSGLCPAGTKDCMVAIYTGNVTEGKIHLAQYQNLAYSADRGRTWTQYADNPVLDLHTKEFRDPNVFWYAPQQKWVMAVCKPVEHQTAFYESKNLTDWKLLSLFGPQGDTTKVWECPALFEVPVEGSSQKKWLLTLSSGHRQKNYLAMQYFVGDFDGTTFTAQPQKEILYVDEGKDFYAGIPFNNLPAGPRSDKPRKPVMIGWLNDWEYANKLPTAPFKGALSVPRELSLQPTPDGYRLVQTPVSLAPRRGKAITLTNLTVTGTLPLNFTGESYELETAITLGSARKISIHLLKSSNETSTLVYEAATRTLSFNRTRSGNVSFSDRFASVESVVVEPQKGVLKLHVLVDTSIVEVFANDGQQVMTDLVFPIKHQGKLELAAEEGTAVFKTLTIWPIR